MLTTSYGNMLLTMDGKPAPCTCIPIQRLATDVHSLFPTSVSRPVKAF